VDIGISEDKAAAIGANAADIGVALALRGKKGAMPFVLPAVAYGVARMAISTVTGKGETVGGTRISQRIASEVIGTVESNQPVIPIEGLRHDGIAGDMRRRNTDFGSGYQGLAPIEQQKETSGLWNVTRTVASGALLAAGVMSRDTTFNQTLSQWFGRASPLVRVAPAAMWLSSELKDIATGPDSLPVSITKLAGGIGVWEVAKRSAIRLSKPLSVKLRHKGLPGLLGHAAAIGATTMYGGLIRRNKPVNPIKGHDAGHWGRDQIFASGDFEPGSSYKNIEQRERNFSLIPAVVGAGVSALTYAALYPWAARHMDLDKYPRLKRLRTAGQQYGMRTLTATGPELLDKPFNLSSKQEVLNKLKMQLLYAGPLGATKKPQKLAGFQGVVYIQSGEKFGAQLPSNATISNFGAWDVGRDKLATWEYLKSINAESMHVETLAGKDFYQTVAGKTTVSNFGKRFIQEAGGLENLVLKEKDAARGVGVWLNAGDLPTGVAEKFYKHPSGFILQKKMNLAEEFRVVTVGGKASNVTYRFGTPWMQDLAKKLGYTPTKELLGTSKVARMSPFEVIAPVLRQDYRKPLIEFAEKAAAKLPYDIGALDIGLTKEGKFMMIEAQREFGNISNPLVSRRVKHLVTGKPGMGSIVLAAGLGLMAVGLLSSESNKPVVPIKGHDAWRWGREQTFADGDFEPGSSWKGLLRALRHPIKSVRAWQFQRGINRATSEYSILGRKAATRLGINNAVVKVHEAGGVIGMEAFGKKGESLFSTVRSFERGSIDIINTDVAPFLQRKGTAGFLQKGEIDIWHKMGYKTGATVRATVVHPATAKLRLRAFGGKMERTALQESLEHELVRVGQWKPKAATFEERILAGEYTKEQFIGGATTGRLPSSKAPNKIVAHTATWARKWVQKILDTDFMPGASWIGQAVKRGVSWKQIGRAAGGSGKELEALYKTDGLKAVTQAVRGANVVSAGGRRFIRGKEIGEGSFKKVFEAYEIGRGAKAGQKFAYAERIAGVKEGITTTPFLRTGTAGAVEGKLGISEAKVFVGEYKQSMQAHMAKYANHPLGAEIAAQQMARKSYGSVVPEVIGATEKGFVQEFAGTMLPQSHTTKAFGAAQKHYEKVLANSGTKVLHYDLHAGNVLRKGSKLSIIDWGLAAPTAVTPEIAQTGKQLMDFYVKRQVGRVNPQMLSKTAAPGAFPTYGKGVFSRVGTPEALIKQLETAKIKASLAQQENLFVQGSKRKQRLNKLQEIAQPLPFKLNAKRTMSHGVDRTKRTI
jgi:hypothetical protein